MIKEIQIKITQVLPYFMSYIDSHNLEQVEPAPHWSVSFLKKKKKKKKKKKC